MCGAPQAVGTEVGAYASMFGELVREPRPSKGSRSKGVVLDETRTICPVLEEFCMRPEGMEAIESLTRISARIRTDGASQASRKGCMFSHLSVAKSQAWLACSVCGSRERLHGCLENVFVGCWEHTQQHMKANGYRLAVSHVYPASLRRNGSTENYPPPMCSLWLDCFGVTDGFGACCDLLCCDGRLRVRPGPRAGV